MSKVLILIENNNIIQIGSDNPNLEIVVVDRINNQFDQGVIVTPIKSPDSIAPYMYELISPEKDLTVHETLRDLNF